MPPSTGIVQGNNEPLYNIGVVSRMTGISMATLRAWERRYDFPDSDRTPGGHRLYSERDVMQLRWVKSLIDEGMQTAQAINALRHQEETGHLVLKPATSNLDLIHVHEYPEGIPELGEGGQPYFKAYQDRISRALLNHDPDSADQFIAEILAVSTPEDIILQVIRPIFNQVGEQWEKGRINVATEHFATNYLRQRLLTWMLSGPPPRQVAPIILACAPDEWHEGSLLILGALLRRRRWPVTYLGQALPLKDLASFIRDLNPYIVILVAMTAGTAAKLADWPDEIPEVARINHPVICYGGRVFVEEPKWCSRVKGIYLGNTFEEGLQTIEQLLAQQY